MFFSAVALAQTDPQAMKKVAQVDARFQSYNVEMVEIVGGRFWRPYTSTPIKDLPAPVATGIAGVDPTLFEQRTPVNLTDPKLRKLAAALGPAYMRVSGSWANTVYFQDSDAAAPAAPPKGYGGVLTRAEWKGVIEFAKAVDARLVTSFSVGEGARDASGAWMPGQTEAFLRYTRQAGGRIAAAEFFNEPTIPAIAGVPKDYDAAGVCAGLQGVCSGVSCECTGCSAAGTERHRGGDGFVAADEACGFQGPAAGYGCGRSGCVLVPRISDDL